MPVFSSGFKESISTRNPIDNIRCREEAANESIKTISIRGWDPKTWESYIYYLNTGGYSYLPDGYVCDLLDLFRLADMVCDKDLVARLVLWFERSSNSENIIPRVFSEKYQGFYLAPVQRRLREIFLNLWLNDEAVRRRAVEFLNRLDSKVNSDGWNGEKARKLYCRLMINLPYLTD